MQLWIPLHVERQRSWSHPSSQKTLRRLEDGSLGTSAPLGTATVNTDSAAIDRYTLTDVPEHIQRVTHSQTISLHKVCSSTSSNTSRQRHSVISKCRTSRNFVGASAVHSARAIPSSESLREVVKNFLVTLAQDVLEPQSQKTPSIHSVMLPTSTENVLAKSKRTKQEVARRTLASSSRATESMPQPRSEREAALIASKTELGVAPQPRTQP